MQVPAIVNPVPAIEHMHDILDKVQTLRDELYFWEAQALQYKEAFESQTARLHELLDILVATQAELENERLTSQRCKSESSQRTKVKSMSNISSDGTAETSRFSCDGQLDGQHDITAISEVGDSAIKGDFGYARILMDIKSYPAALEEVDRVLPGPMTQESRVEALLLKSAILRGTGPQWLYDALAQCSEALELCTRLSHLQSLLPQVQYQRGLCLFELGMYSQAQQAFAAVGSIKPHRPSGMAERDYQSRNDESASEISLAQKRRSGFDEHRTVTEGFPERLKDESRDVCLSRSFKL